MTTPTRLSLLLLLEPSESVAESAARYASAAPADLVIARIGDQLPAGGDVSLPTSVIDAGTHRTRTDALRAAIGAIRTDWIVLAAAGTTLDPRALTAFEQAIGSGSHRMLPLVGTLGSEPHDGDTAATAPISVTPLDAPLLDACAGSWSASAPLCLPVAAVLAAPDTWHQWQWVPEFALALEVAAQAGGMRRVPLAQATATTSAAVPDHVAAVQIETGLVLDTLLATRRFEELVSAAAAKDSARMAGAAKSALTSSVNMAAPLHAGVGQSPVLVELLRDWLQRMGTVTLRDQVAQASRQLADQYALPPALDTALRAIDQPTPIEIPPRQHRMAREQARAVGLGDLATARRLAQWLATSVDSAAHPDGTALSPQYQTTTRVAMYRALDAALQESGDVPAVLARASDLFPDDPTWTELQALLESRGPHALRTRLGFQRPWHLRSIPRIAHFYWGGERTSFLRYLTVASFRRANPDWEVRVHVPRTVHRRAAEWTTREAYEGSTFLGRDYSRDLYALADVDIVEVDFERWPALANAAETFKADFFRWHVLATEGGLYSDADIAYHRPVRYAAFNVPDHADARVGLCAHHGHQFIGFLFGAPGAACYRRLLVESPKAFDPLVYQSIGSHLLQRCYPTVESLAEQHPSDKPFNIDMDVVYAFDWRQIGALHAPGDPKSLPAGAIGIHWFGGAGQSQRYNECVTHATAGHHGSLLDSYVARVTAVLPDAPGRRRFPTRTRGPVRFSVLVPSYQQAHYLPETLESLLNQTWDDFEVVVVDDGSTDGTREVIAEWMARDRRIVGLTQENGGTGAALNSAFAHARGDRICWLSSDDLFEPTALATFADAQGIWPQARFFHANFSLLHEAAHRLEPMPERRQLTAIPAPAEQTLALLRANYVNGITICIDRALVQEAGGWDTRYRWAQDFDLWLRLSVRTPLQYVDARVGRTRIHAGQDTSKFPMAGMWDSARAVHALLARHDFAALTPFANLDTDDGMVRAVYTVASALCDPQAFVYQGVGPNIALLGHVAAWSAGSRRRGQMFQALCHIVATSTTAPAVIREVASVLQADPGALGASPLVAIEEMQRRLSSGELGSLAGEMTRYLERVTSTAPRSRPEARPISARRRAG